MDKHKDQWDRFSWFGFRTVIESKDENGFKHLKRMPKLTNGNPHEIIGDVEALSIKSMSLRNISQMNFAYRGARKAWVQIKQDEVQKYCTRLD